MQRNLQPWITTGVVLAGASLIAVNPMATPRPDVQHRQVRLVDYDEFDLSQLTTTTEANWSGLETVLSSSNWLTDPDISQGLSTVLSDLSTGTSNPVTDPTSLLAEGGATAHQQRRCVERGRHRADGRHGQRRVGAEQRRLFRGAHRPGKRAHHGPGRLPQRLPGNRWLRADFARVRAAHQHHRRRGHRPDRRPSAAEQHHCRRGVGARRREFDDGLATRGHGHRGLQCQPQSNPQRPRLDLRWCHAHRQWAS